MKQRILAILLSLTMMFTLVPTAMAADGESSGNCGATEADLVTWELTDDDGDGFYTLTISGNGNMAGYTANINNAKATQPWRESETGVESKKLPKWLCLKMLLLLVTSRLTA